MHVRKFPIIAFLLVSESHQTVISAPPSKYRLISETSCSLHVYVHCMSDLLLQWLTVGGSLQTIKSTSTVIYLFLVLLGVLSELSHIKSVIELSYLILLLTCMMAFKVCKHYTVISSSLSTRNQCVIYIAIGTCRYSDSHQKYIQVINCLVVHVHVHVHVGATTFLSSITRLKILTTCNINGKN